MTIRFGNGALAPSGIFKPLCEAYIDHLRHQAHSGGKDADAAGKITFEWIVNPSRFNQLLLHPLDMPLPDLADDLLSKSNSKTKTKTKTLADLAFTYEREDEKIAEEEGWMRSLGVFCWDEMVLVGPRDDPAGISDRAGLGVLEAMKRIAEAAKKEDELVGEEGRKVRWTTRGDGSKTMTREHELWEKIGLRPHWELKERQIAGAASGKSVSSRSLGDGWYTQHYGMPTEAISHASITSSYMLTDRVSYLIAKSKNLAPNLRCFVESSGSGGFGLGTNADDEDLMENGCAVCVRADEDREEVLGFGRWLFGEEGQGVVEGFRVGVEEEGNGVKMMRLVRGAGTNGFEAAGEHEFFQVRRRDVVLQLMIGHAGCLYAQIH